MLDEAFVSDKFQRSEIIVTENQLQRSDILNLICIFTLSKTNGY